MASPQLQVGQTCPFTVFPEDASGNQTAATLSNVTASSANTAIFTVAADPSNPSGGIVTAVAAGSGQINVAADALDPGATSPVHVTGSDTVVVASPPAPPTTALGIHWGTPTTPTA